MTPQYITKQTLESVSIDLSDQDIDLLLEHLNETLQERVGGEIVDSLSDEQLEQLASLQEVDDETAIANWLQQNVAEMKQIVQDEIDILLGELAESSDEINNS